jgi:hypothetical protein
MRNDRLGLLGTITGDGFTRMLDFTLRYPSPDSGTLYLHLHSPVFAVAPPRTAICTALAFASPSTLVLTTSTGALNIYNIANSIEDCPPAPIISHQLQTNLISAIFIAYASSYPNILASASRSGILSFNGHARSFYG